MSAHTPGPWVIEWADGSYQIEAASTDEPGTIHLVAGLVSLNDTRLIAAAPELLEALKDCRRALEVSGYTGELAVVDAAIAKATGRPA